MEWIQVFEGFGLPMAMLIYFIWNNHKRDAGIADEREKHAEEFKAAHEAHINAEKDSLLKYIELTRQIAEVIVTVQRDINSLTDKTTELVAIIRSQRK